MAPENVVLVALPTLKTVCASAPVCTVPPPARDPRVWLRPLRSSVAPVLTVVLLTADITWAALATRLPALRVVVPVWLSLPPTVRLLAPVFSKAPVPETAELKLLASLR